MSNHSVTTICSASFVAGVTGGVLNAPEALCFSGVAIDSRKVQPGNLFVAIRGERADGHDYVAKALDSGASFALVSKPIDPSLPHILVDDTTAALGRLALAHRKALSPITVGVTGSVGKTTTKQLIGSVLSTVYETHLTEGNQNNEIGLPLTLLSLSPDHRAAVIEMGMSQIGEIEYLSHLALPDIGVVTCIGTSHLETLGSRERIRDAKLEIRAGMNENGVLILNGDEPLLRGIEGAIYVGFAPVGRHTRTICHLRSEADGSLFDLEDEDGHIMHDIFVPGFGTHLVYDAALACTAGKAAGIGESDIHIGISRFKNTGMRQRIEDHGGITLIIDCYNAAPESMKAALNVLRDTKTAGRKIAVLGDMLELGELSPQLHRSVGEYAAYNGADLLFTFGPRAAEIASGALSAKMPQDTVFSFPEIGSPDKLAERLKEEARPSDAVLFKASRGIALERVIEKFKEI